MKLQVVPKSTPQKATHTTVDTIVVTPEIMKGWKNPPFQRPLRVNDKVRALSERIKLDGGVLPGVITLGVLSREKYLLDGQHRREAYLLSGCEEGFTDVRLHHFDTMADMGEEFVNLNSALVRLRPDDILRGLEGSLEGLTTIRRRCPFVGYDFIRRGEKSPILSMAMVLRSWFGSAPDVPTSSGDSAQARAVALSVTDAEACCEFLLTAERAWGREAQYARLWGTLNLTLCAWIYRRTVLTQYSPKSARLTKDLFKNCLMSLSASDNFIDWLLGRQLSERDRSPAYGRIKSIFVKRIEVETGTKPQMPAPAWSSHASGLKTLR